MKVAAVPKHKELGSAECLHRLTDIQGLVAKHLYQGAGQAHLLAAVLWRREVYGGITPNRQQYPWLVVTNSPVSTASQQQLAGSVNDDKLLLLLLLL